MRKINSAAEFKNFYPYKSPPSSSPCPKPEEYPKEYPCFAEVISHDGGLGGPYKTVRIVYPPKGCDLKSFAAGLKAMEDYVT